MSQPEHHNSLEIIEETMLELLPLLDREEAMDVMGSFLGIMLGFRNRLRRQCHTPELKSAILDVFPEEDADNPLLDSADRLADEDISKKALAQEFKKVVADKLNESNVKLGRRIGIPDAKLGTLLRGEYKKSPVENLYTRLLICYTLRAALTLLLASLDPTEPDDLSVLNFNDTEAVQWAIGNVRTQCDAVVMLTGPKEKAEFEKALESIAENFDQILMNDLLFGDLIHERLRMKLDRAERGPLIFSEAELSPYREINIATIETFSPEIILKLFYAGRVEMPVLKRIVSEWLMVNQGTEFSSFVKMADFLGITSNLGRVLEKNHEDCRQTRVGRILYETTLHRAEIEYAQTHIVKRKIPKTLLTNESVLEMLTDDVRPEVLKRIVLEWLLPREGGPNHVSELAREIKLKDANVRDNLNTNRVFTGHKATVRPVLIPYLRKVAEERIAARKKNLS